MNLWAVSSLPVYSERGARGRSEKRSKSSSVSVITANHRLAPASSKTTTPTSTTSPVPAFAPSNHGRFLHHDPFNYSHNELVEPSINGPPSPESIRQLSKQMKKASQGDKHLSHHTTSSGSSSLRSLTSTDSPSTDGAFSLSRRSSGRSTNSHIMPNRDRPESVQIFGKTLFNRRGRLKRESSSQNLYSAESGSEANLPLAPTSQPAPTSAPSRDSSIPAFFSRRRTIKAENAEDSVGQRKIQISGPYNFQHVAHTKKGSNVDDLHFSDFSSDSLPLTDVDLPPSHRPASISAKQTSPRRLVKHAKSQDSMSIAPPRPPRSPIEESVPVPPVPGIPPRVSSRVSTTADGLDPLILGRPQTSTGHRQAPSLSLDADGPTPPMTSHGHTRMVSVPDNDLNWPLPAPANSAFDAAPLPNVPEEEEAASIMRPSRASVISNSSLRASQSVPMLRAFSPRQSDYDHHSREPSDTLGPCNLREAQRALVSALDDILGCESLPRESWEDDIDYCYEHAAEADCDYEWDRPSLDISRDCGSTTPVEHHYHRKKLSCNPSASGMLIPAQLDIPSLSPVSLNSAITTPHEAITPTGMTAALPGPGGPTFTHPSSHSHSHKTSNFSLPRIEAPMRSPSDLLKTPELHARKPSDASSFKESHGFTLSPSLLIPTDFQRQMRLDSLDEGSSGAEGDFTGGSGEYPFGAHAFCEPGISSLKYNPHRASASTTATLESINSGRHVSTASISTDFTRLTLSTNSLVDMDGCNFESPVCEFGASENNHVRSESVSAKGAAMPPVPEFEEISDESLRRGESFPNLVGLGRQAQDGAEVPVTGAKRKDSMLGGLQRPGRGRARTTSLSTPPPPNQFSLFPNVRLTGPQI
ncbi:hypothetical protein QBC32DRAFT_49660 [Pseudoneurospora amorphoporcata]|uniref:CRIB domain-containing protein n=1 Tax=Pseudoneurospora amorphoporcata TaxID=241081 RepID=A0AAN6NMW0_9PEZI|nr:hypothetical protein QBC32DRAFT_49660 [Pseudoneurospora amorphoporcata]